MNRLPETLRNRIEIDGDCWKFTGAQNSRGYGSVTNGRGGTMLAHRLAYEAAVGKIPTGLTIDHLCMVKTCLNPAHMEPVTRSENTRRKLAAQTHCKRGHELSGANLRTQKRATGRTFRICKACAELHTNRYRSKQLGKPISQFYGEAAA